MASVTANHAFHTSATWTRAEAEAAIKASTLDTIVISVTCGFVGMIIFTQDLFLASCVCLLVIAIISGLAFWIVAVMGWPIGPIEAISLVVFVGYSVTYGLHIAHVYGTLSIQGAWSETQEEGSPQQK